MQNGFARGTYSRHVSNRVAVDLVGLQTPKDPNPLRARISRCAKPMGDVQYGKVKPGRLLDCNFRIADHSPGIQISASAGAAVGHEGSCYLSNSDVLDADNPRGGCYCAVLLFLAGRRSGRVECRSKLRSVQFATVS